MGSFERNGRCKGKPELCTVHLEGARDRCMAFHVQLWVGVVQ